MCMGAASATTRLHNVKHHQILQHFLQSHSFEPVSVCMGTSATTRLHNVKHHQILQHFLQSYSSSFFNPSVSAWEHVQRHNVHTDKIIIVGTRYFQNVLICRDQTENWKSRILFNNYPRPRLLLVLFYRNLETMFREWRLAGLNMNIKHSQVPQLAQRLPASFFILFLQRLEHAEKLKGPRPATGVRTTNAVWQCPANCHSWKLFRNAR